MSNELHERISQLEKDVHTLNHRMNVNDGEAIPRRVASIEPIVEQIRKDVSRMEINVDAIKESLSRGISDLQSEVASQKSAQRTFLMALGGMFALIQAWPAIREVLRGLL